MTMTFDLDDDERPIFMAESDEQLQVLDEGFVRLEHEAGNPDLLQTIFRAAHTLKGSAGVIGHRRMAEVTHGLETVLDGLRKGTLSVKPELIDVCLEALDGLRLLLGEVAQGQESGLEIKPLVARLALLAVAAPVVPEAARLAPIVVTPALTPIVPNGNGHQGNRADGEAEPAVNGARSPAEMPRPETG